MSAPDAAVDQIRHYAGCEWMCGPAHPSHRDLVELECGCLNPHFRKYRGKTRRTCTLCLAYEPKGVTS